MDITERREMERRSTSNRMHAALFDNFPDLILVLTPRGNYTFVSRAALGPGSSG